MQKKIRKAFWVLEITAAEMIALNINFYRERIFVTVSQYVNKQSQDFRYY